MLNQTTQDAMYILNPFTRSFETMELHERIYRAIELSRHNQKEIAAFCKVSPGALTQWKQGKVNNLKLENLYRLADITGFSARWIAIEEGPERSAELPGVQLTSQETALLSIYRDLTEEQQSLLFGIIRGMKSVEAVARPPKKQDRKNKKAVG